MEQFLGDDSALIVEAQISDREEYAVKLVYTTKNILGESITYTMYYNEEEIAEINPDAPEHGDDISSEAEKEDYESMLTGIIVVGETEYTLEGLRRFDASGEEEEIVMYSKLDSQNYVKVKYEIEKNEKKFVYEVVAEGVVTSRTRVKLETEDNETKIVLSFLEGANSGEYTFKQEVEDGVTIIKIKYVVTDELGEVEKGEMRIIVTTDELTGESTYEYYIKADGKEGEKHMNKERHEHNYATGNGGQNGGQNNG